MPTKGITIADIYYNPGILGLYALPTSWSFLEAFVALVRTVLIVITEYEIVKLFYIQHRIVNLFTILIAVFISE